MRILFTGGSACGKSTYAENLAASLPLPRFYIAAMRPFGDESLGKIARNRRIRASRGFETIERYTDMAGIRLPVRGTALLECLCNLTANEMFDSNGVCRDAFDDLMRGIIILEEQCDNLIVVTNDVGSGGCAYPDETRRYIEALGRLNIAVAERFDTVLELVCGIPVARKGRLP